MKAFLRRHLPVMITAAVVSVVMSAGPTVAAAVYDAVNAHKVDGRHAVGSGATTAQRAGELVATNSQGRLPNGIIAKAPDADRLDGVTSSGFLRDAAGSVGGGNILDWSVQRGDLAPDATGPFAYGLVLHYGEALVGRPFVGFTVTKPDSTTGLYCIGGLDRPVRSVTATPSLYLSGPTILGVTEGMDEGCPEGTQYRVYVWAMQGLNPATDGSFYLEFS